MSELLSEPGPSLRQSSRLFHHVFCRSVSSDRLKCQGLLGHSHTPVNENGSFEFDRVIKCGILQKRTQKTKKWKPIFLLLRPNTLSIYKTENEEKLRHKIYLADLTAVMCLKDPKHKRNNVFGLFSPARNFHFQASTFEEAQTWVELIRRDARLTGEEDEMLLYGREAAGGQTTTDRPDSSARLLSSASDLLDPPSAHFMSSATESSGLSGNEQTSHSDFSDSDVHRLHRLSIEVVQPVPPSAPIRFSHSFAGATSAIDLVPMSPVASSRPDASGRKPSQDPDRVVWQGRLWFLRSKGGVRQWKDSWAVLRPRNLILYKDESEYTAQFIVPLPTILNVVDIDPVTRTKNYCLQIITEEKSYRLCARDEESLVQCLGAFKSLLSKRRELEILRAASSS